MTSDGCHASHPVLGAHHPIRPLGWAVVISVIGHLIATSWGTTTPSPSAHQPAHVKLVHRIEHQPTTESPTPDRSTPGDVERVTQAPSTHNPPAPTDSDEASFLPPSSLDHAPLPKSDATLEVLDDIPTTGMLISLRLYIDETGVVKYVAPLAFAPDDEAAVRQLQQVFMATTFLPGQRKGRYVRSYLDIEITPDPLH